jgi:hypothetical protein
VFLEDIAEQVSFKAGLAGQVYFDKYYTAGLCGAVFLIGFFPGAVGSYPQKDVESMEALFRGSFRSRFVEWIPIERYGDWMAAREEFFMSEGSWSELGLDLDSLIAVMC